MVLQQLREEVAFYGKEMVRQGMTLHTGGNLSAIDREQGLVAIKPSARPYDCLLYTSSTIVPQRTVNYHPNREEGNSSEENE